MTKSLNADQHGKLKEKGGLFMGDLSICALVPHPPLLIPEVGGASISRVERTKDAMENISRAIACEAPEVLILITPHGPLFKDAIGIIGEEELSGDFSRFGAPDVDLSFKSDLQLIRLIENQDCGIKTLQVTSKNYPGAEMLDHGSMVPLYYLKKAGLDIPLVVMGFGFLPFKELYAFGKAIGRAIESSGKRVAIIASGDLSHRLTPDAPAGYDPAGKEFDQRLMASIETMDVDTILNMDRELVERAGECGLRSILIMLGALDGLLVSPKVLSYEGPFGVGYGVALFSIIEESSPVRLARQSVEEYVRHRRVIEEPHIPPPEIRGQAGAFVSIKKNGNLRGCIGTVEAIMSNVGKEIIMNAISAATRDPRFPPVTEDELGTLTYSVDILKEPERISGLHELDPQRYGVIVSKGKRRGLLLPNLEGIHTPEEQVAIAKRKAGISPADRDVTLERFEVIRWT